MSEKSVTFTNARQRSQAETRKRLQNSAARLFAKEGLKKTRTSDIAREAGVAVGTVYLHFKDKDALLEDILGLALSQLKIEISSFADPKPSNPTQIVAQKMEALVLFCEKHPDLATVLFDPGNCATIPGRKVLSFLAESQENGILTGISAGYYRKDLHTGLLSLAMVGVLVHVLNWWVKNTEELSREEVIRNLVEIRMQGLSPRG